MSFAALQALICLIDKKTGEKSRVRPRFVKQDQIAIVRLEVTGGLICLEPFKEFPQMGRFTLRDEGTCARTCGLLVWKEVCVVMPCLVGGRARPGFQLRFRQ